MHPPLGGVDESVTQCHGHGFGMAGQRCRLGKGTEKRLDEVSRIIVCDTGSLLHLGKAGTIHLLRYAANILISPAISIEFKRSVDHESNRKMVLY